MTQLVQQFTSVAQCETYLFSLRSSGKRQEPLQIMNALLEAVGNPQQRVPFVHIAGTNGKGSTVNFLREILQQANIRVGAFTSPHLERMNERMTINGNPIDDASLIRYVNAVMAIIVEQQLQPNFFEVMTVIAWLYFADAQVDIALIEVGIGGRIDSTNVATPLVSIITSIGFDHVEILGHTIRDITHEKAGIIKAQIPIVSTVLQHEAQQLIAKTAQSLKAPHYQFGQQFAAQFTVTTGQQLGEFHNASERFSFELTMLGEHQGRNAAAAMQAAQLLASQFTISVAHIQRGVQRASWAGRFEQVAHHVYVDGAHNEQGTQALIATLQQAYPNYRYHFLYAAMADKDHAQSIAQMDEVAQSMAFTTLPLPRAASAQQLADESRHAHKKIVPHWQAYIEETMQNLSQQELLIVTGSLYFISEARPFIQQLEAHLHGDTRFSTL